MAKISISLPDRSIKILDEISQRIGYSRSALISSMMANRLQRFSSLSKIGLPKNHGVDMKRFRGVSIEGLEEVLFTLENQVTLFDEAVEDNDISR